MKRILSLLSFIFIISTVVVPISVNGAIVLGDDCDYLYDSDKKDIYIYGYGDIKNFTNCPFASLSNEIENVVIEEGITTLGNNLFANCKNLKSVEIPDSLLKVNFNVFFGCASLEEINLKLVENVDVSAFNNCTNLTFIDVDKYNNAYSSVNGVLYNKDCSKLIKVPANYNLKELYIDETSFIGDYALSDNLKIEKVSLSSNVTLIDENCFFNSNVKELTIENKECQIKEILLPDNCIVKGYNDSTAQQYAIDYGHEFISLNPIVHTHVMNTVVVQPTCTQDGYSLRRCECGYEADKNVLNPKGHTYSKTTKQATMSANGYIKYVCNVCNNEDKTRYSTINKISKVSFNHYKYYYDGKKHIPTVSIYDSKNTKLKANTDYTLSYPKTSVNVNKYNVVITFKGKYKGSKTVAYTIIPAKTSITKYSYNKNSITLNFKKITKQSTGYSIAYGVKNNKGKIVYKYVNVAANNNSYTIPKLKSKTTYYVKMRTYKIVGKSKIYSNYTKEYNIKTK